MPACFKQAGIYIRYLDLQGNSVIQMTKRLAVTHGLIVSLSYRQEMSDHLSE